MSNEFGDYCRSLCSGEAVSLEFREQVLDWWRLMGWVDPKKSFEAQLLVQSHGARFAESTSGLAWSATGIVLSRLVLWRVQPEHAVNNRLTGEVYCGTDGPPWWCWSPRRRCR